MKYDISETEQLRLRQDSGDSKPAYTLEQVEEYLQSGRARTEAGRNGTQFILDTQQNDKIMAVIEPKR